MQEPINSVRNSFFYYTHGYFTTLLSDVSDFFFFLLLVDVEFFLDDSSAVAVRSIFTDFFFFVEFLRCFFGFNFFFFFFIPIAVRYSSTIFSALPSARTFPWSIQIARVQTCSTNRILCETIITAFAPSFTSCIRSVPF